MKILKNYWPLFIIGAVVLFLAIINYRPGMILTGGDNLHPEFDLALNIRRSLFAVWQEYQGLGVLGAMGHASDLIRQLILWPVSLLLPTELVRYVWTMLTLLIGSIGAYYLIRKIIGYHLDNHSVLSIKYQVSSENEKIYNTQYLIPNTVALLGALFYLLNLGTIQQYYTPFEVFTSQFAALPWLFLTTINYFQQTTRKNLLLLALTLLLATPQGYVPTLFVVWLMATGILTIFLAFKTVKPFALRTMPFAKYYALVFVINAFWLLPFAYFVMTNVHVDVNAKINQMASENIYLMNKEYGNLSDVMLLRGFWFQNIEPDLTGTITYMFAPWRDHFANPLILGIGFFIFAIVCLGAITAIYSRKKVPMAFAAILFFAIIMLTTATPPFEQLNFFIRELIPLFKEVFRFPFTKFSLLAGLMYGIFFALGIQAIFTFFFDPTKHTEQFASKLERYKKPVVAVCSLLIALSIVLLSLPAFKGELFYQRERVIMPKEYTDLFSYLKTQDKSRRIAVFPHHTFWDWKYYSWGYSGSGFLWYGIEQPILDRAFDMWGQHNENYYFELSQALYANNPAAFEKTLQKYQIGYLLVDKNVTYPPAPQTLAFNELEDITTAIPGLTKERTFGNIELYSVRLPDNPKQHISLHTQLPTVNAYIWASQDQAYADLGSYISYTPDTIRNSYLYPFRSLFSLKNQENQEFHLEEERNAIVLSQTLPPLREKSTLFVPAYNAEQAVIPATVKITGIANGGIRVDLVLAFPEIWYGTTKLTGGEILQQIATLPGNTIPDTLTLNVNGITELSISPDTDEEQSIFLSLREDNVLVLTNEDQQAIKSLTISPDSLQALSLLQEKAYPLPASDTSTVFRVIIPKIEDGYLSFIPDVSEIETAENCDTFREGETSSVITTNNGIGQLQIQARNATACTTFGAPYLPHNEGYAIFITSQHVRGKGFHFWMVNEDKRYAAIDTYLPANKKSSISSFILPPQDTFGNGYSFHLDSISIGNEETENILQDFQAYQIPYQFLTKIVVSADSVPTVSQPLSTDAITVTHPNESLYGVTVTKPFTGQTTLVLGQSFDPGWKMYRFKIEDSGFKNWLNFLFPFFFGEEIKNHVMINNWANGWRITTDASANPGSHFIILYLPQYLQYFGFVLLAGTGISLLFFGRKKHKAKPITER